MSLEAKLAKKPKIAVHKFSSCDGCQLAFLNAGEAFLDLAELVNIKHFLEAGFSDEDAPVDIAFVEGSISTPDERERIKRVRNHSTYVITIGACATAGGIQALRNFNNASDWIAQVYTNPQFIRSLDTATAIKDHIRVDFELWGCPITQRQLLTAIRALLNGVAPHSDHNKVCLECKRQLTPCVIVTRQSPCLGPVTNTGCGAICPQVGRGCYGCFGPAENSNLPALKHWMQGLGLVDADIHNRLAFIYSNTEQVQKIYSRKNQAETKSLNDTNE